MAPALLDGVASLLGDLFVTVETVVFATQTVTGNANTAGPTSESTSAIEPTSTSVIASIESTPTSGNYEVTTVTSTSTVLVDSSSAQPSSAIVINTPAVPITTSQRSSTQVTSSTAIVSSSSSVLTTRTTTSTASLSSLSVLAAISTSPTSNAPLASSINNSPTPSQQDRRPAIIGGLIGAIVGTALIILIIVICCLKRRRRRRDNDVVEQYQQDRKSYLYPPRPEPYRLPTGMSEINFGSVAPLTRPPAASMKSFKSANGNLIRISLDHFTRPFSEREGYRDLAEPGLLRCTNPDRSLPVTPNLASNRLSDPFNKAKSAHRISVVEREIPAYEANAIRQPPPAVYIEGVRNSLVSTHSTYQTAPSFRSYPSIHSSSPRASQWIAEPMPPLPVYSEKMKPKRPALSPLHSVASRTLSSIGNALRLSSSKNVSVAGEKDAQADYARGASWRASAQSDQFDLDSPTRRSEQLLSAQRLSAGRPRHIATYDGT